MSQKSKKIQPLGAKPDYLTNPKAALEYLANGLQKLSFKDRFVVLSQREGFELIEELREVAAYLEEVIETKSEKPSAAAKPESKPQTPSKEVEVKPVAKPAVKPTVQKTAQPKSKAKKPTTTPPKK